MADKKHYETIFIVTPVLSDEMLKNTVQLYMDFIKENKGEIVHEESWGLKELAYPIKKKTTGYYYLVEFKAEGSLIEQLELHFKRDENILRFLTTRLDKYAIEYNEKRRKGEVGTNLEEMNKKEKEEA